MNNYGDDGTTDPSHGESGFGMAVEVCRQLSSEELSKFTRALKILKLDVFVHPSQMQSPALRPPLSDEHGDPDASESYNGSQKSERALVSNGAHQSTSIGSSDDKGQTSTFPRLILLTRSKDFPRVR
jgi:hypothetical protein